MLQCNAMLQWKARQCQFNEMLQCDAIQCNDGIQCNVMLQSAMQCCIVMVTNTKQYFLHDAV